MIPVSMTICQQHVKLLSHAFIRLCPPSVSYTSSTSSPHSSSALLPIPRFSLCFIYFSFPPLSFTLFFSLADFPCLISSSAVISSHVLFFMIPPYICHLPSLPLFSSHHLPTLINQSSPSLVFLQINAAYDAKMTYFHHF